MRSRGLTVLLIIALAAVAQVPASAEAPICSIPPGASPPGLAGCIPSPVECATGDFNGHWESGFNGRFADCTGYRDPVTGTGHILHYEGGVVDPICGAIVDHDRMVAGSWFDPNRCPSEDTATPPGFGVTGRGYRPAVSGTGGAVASVSPEASRAGIAMLDAGGNAIDAAVATVLAVGVTRPDNCGIGGGGFLVYRGANGQTAALDFRETAPAAMRPDSLEVKGINRGINFFDAGIGHLVVGVPGTVAGMAAALERFGTKSLAQTIAPAERLAREGAPISAELADIMFLYIEQLRMFPETAGIYLDEDRDLDGKRDPYAPSPIRRLVQTDYARSLALVAKYGPDAFYQDRLYPEGPSIAHLIAREMEGSRRDPVATPNDPQGVGDQSLMTGNDLASYSPVWREPLLGKYRDVNIVTMPPPTAGGIKLLETLNLLEGFDIGGPTIAHSSADHLHLLAEAQKIAVVDAEAYVGDPDFVDVPVAALTSKGYAKRRRSEITYHAGAPRPGTIHGAQPDSITSVEGANTTHVSVIDAAGNAVAVTCTLNQSFGSAVVAEGAGFLLNDELTDFSGSSSTKNQPEGGKRPRSNTTPAIVVQKGRAMMALGGAGGRKIPMAVAETISNAIDFGYDLARALDVARLQSFECCTVGLEDGRIRADVEDELSKRGHTIIGSGEYAYLTRPDAFVVIQGVGVDRATRRTGAASDPRSDQGAEVQP